MTGRGPRAGLTAVLAVAALAATACDTAARANRSAPPPARTGTAAPTSPTLVSPTLADSPPPSATPRPTATPGPAASARSPGTSPPHADSGGRGEARPELPVSLSIPAIGVEDLRVIGYRGHADDRPGTRIQDRGLAAHPTGPPTTAGPGEVGNFLVTGHRTSAGGPFRRLPSLRTGAHVLVRTGGMVYDYVVTATMTISFRSARSLARQSAPVPGHPGRPATQAMITLSTCATPEDHAAGNHWADALGNPEHRIDKVGVLTAIHR